MHHVRREAIRRLARQKGSPSQRHLMLYDPLPWSPWGPCPRAVQAKNQRRRNATKQSARVTVALSRTAQTTVMVRGDGEGGGSRPAWCYAALEVPKGHRLGPREANAVPPLVGASRLTTSPPPGWRFQAPPLPPALAFLLLLPWRWAPTRASLRCSWPRVVALQC